MLVRALALVLAALPFAACRDREPSAAPPNHSQTATTASAVPGVASSGGTTSSAAVEQAELQNSKGESVPFHAARGDSAVAARVPVGTRVSVLERSGDGAWLRVRAPDGTEGWITRRYAALGPKDAGGSRSGSELLPQGSIWRSRADCEAALAAGKRLPRPSGVARLATWNVRWFPDGKPGGRASEVPTDLAWLGCALAWLDVDAVAVQEFKLNDRARDAVKTLLQTLDGHTHGHWAADFDDCPNLDAQHVGIFHDERRVKADKPLTLAALNPHGDACKDNLRPGLGVYLKFPGGLDLHFVSVHAKSGPERRSIDLRERSLRALDSAQTELGKAHADPDVLVAGDFNTMGCKECSPAIGAEDELGRTDSALSKLTAPMRRLRASKPCSEYHAQHGTLLDHFFASRAFVELPADATSVVSGVCGEAACQVLPKREKLEAEERLSDHCPVVLDVPDRDQD